MIRKVNTNDKELYISLMQEFYNSDSVINRIPYENFEKTFLEVAYSGTYAKGYIFEIDEIPVGYALTAKTFSNESGGIIIWIEELYVKPKYRSKGIGKSFFEYLLKECDSEVKKIRLEVRRDNKRAYELYKNLGFKESEYMQMYKDL